MNIKGIINPGSENKIFNLGYFSPEPSISYFMEGNLSTFLRIELTNDSVKDEMRFIVHAMDIQKSDYEEGEKECVKAVARFTIEKVSGITPGDIYPAIQRTVEILNEKIVEALPRLQSCHHIHDCPELAFLHNDLTNLIEALP